MFHLSLGMIAFFILAKATVAFWGDDGAGPELMEAGLDRSSFGILRIANFAACLFAVIYVVVAGPTSPRRWIAALGRVCVRVFTFRPLVFLGKRSLQVYALHVVLVYAVQALVLTFGTPGPAAANLLLVACWALLFVPGLWKARAASRKRASRAA